MGPSEKEACVLLDTRLLAFMDQLEILEEKRERLNSLIEQGWFSMTKARYSMGNKQVSALQYGSEMQPLVRVHTSTLDNGKAEFQIERTAPGERTVEDIGPKDTGGLRRRTHFTEEVVKAEGYQGYQPSAGTEAEKEPLPSSKVEPDLQQDPIRWFGILVPQTLRQAQVSFRQVVELSAEVAALQSAVLTTREQLQLQMKLKRRSQNEGQKEGQKDSD
ncbi:hypothetical protein UPYG_G00000570 [Umbra pygmaea]|uniref:Vacuolar ATPase assembly protein VMA22 n=1 Tax=Umbra pygmaea TaxID=75934 RepID=A0ABD0XG95_UMBPY